MSRTILTLPVPSLTLSKPQLTATLSLHLYISLETHPLFSLPIDFYSQIGGNGRNYPHHKPWQQSPNIFQKQLFWIFFVFLQA